MNSAGKLIRAFHTLGLRNTAAVGFRRIAAALDRSDRASKKTSTLEEVTMEASWSDYLTWLTFCVPGMLDRGNVDAMAFALKHLPNDAPMLEIGSFCGLSTCVLSYLRQKYSITNLFFTCDRWAFEGQELGKHLGDSKTVTHDQYRKFIRDSFLRNTETFCQRDIPHTIEADSDTLFQWWSESKPVTDVFARNVKIGGPLSFCHIDGNHTYEFAKRDFENTDRFLVPGGFILFDDSGDGSGWEVCKVVDEVLKSGSYHLIAKNPNYLVQKS
jgi:hypothetical protein